MTSPAEAPPRSFVGLMRKLVTLMVLVAAPPTALFFLMSRPEKPPYDPPHTDYAADRIDAIVGLYEMEGHERVLVTYSARGGGVMFGLNGATFSRADYLSRSVLPRDDDTVAWEPFEDGPPRFISPRSDGEHVMGFSWHEASQRHSATRLDAGFTQREVTWTNGDVLLTGTAFLPDSPAAVGAVLVHGSGWSDRDNLWYLHFVIRLVESGVATLFPDKRGSGKSEGDWRTASFEDFARDALSARARLAELSNLDPSRIGLVGMSQGGSGVAPMATSLTNDLPFVVNVSGSNVPTREQLVLETHQNLRQMGVPAVLDWFMHPYAMAIAERKRRTWWQLNGDYDPQAHWRSSKTPLLVLYGSEDERDNVPVAHSVQRFEELKRADIVVKVYDGVGHGLFSPTERVILPDALDRVVMWAHRPGR